MPKRRPAFDARQGVLEFDAPQPRRALYDMPVSPPIEAELSGIERRVASAVGVILAEAQKRGLTRHEIAIDMSELLDATVTKDMLNAYSSEARETHNISMGRFLALIAATGAYPVLAELLRGIGVGTVVGEEIAAVELANTEAQIRELQARQKQLRQVVTPIRRGK